MVYGCCYGLSFLVNELFMGMVNESILWFGYGYSDQAKISIHFYKISKTVSLHLFLLID